ncbi:MAG TPA: amino acid racemase [Candidatus Paceibacterota bacterium]|nr:amino acid racemase [Candidatus Paceibacterota bacterium]
MKTVGIIGGLGPETTSEFYLELIFSCRKINHHSYPSIFINSIPLPFDIEKNAIAEGIGEEKCLPYLINAAKSLEKAGADFLVLPCNSLHVFIGDIRSAVKIPVLSILEETAMFLEKEMINKVGVIATPITIKNKLCEKFLKHNKIKQITPDNLEQVKIGKLIHSLVSNRYVNKDREILIKIINDFAKDKVEHVILACTDLQLLMPQHTDVKIYDTMKILVDATVKNIAK